MPDDLATAEPARAYAAAYAAHYRERDLPLALRLYTKLIASHSGSRESSYARVQLLNIVNAVVPSDEILGVQLELARARLEDAMSPDRG